MFAADGHSKRNISENTGGTIRRGGQWHHLTHGGKHGDCDNTTRGATRTNTGKPSDGGGSTR